MKLLGGEGLELVCGRPTLAVAVGSALFCQTKQLKRIKHRRKAKIASNEITGGGGGGGGGLLQLVCGRPALAFSSELVSLTLNFLVCIEEFWLIRVLS